MNVVELSYSAKINPHEHLEDLYRNQSVEKWEINYETLPNKQLQEWKLADDYWKLYICLKKGKPIGIDTEIYKPPTKEKKFSYIIGKTFGYIYQHCLTENHDYSLVVTDTMVVVIFATIVLDP